uniref:Protein CLEC16A homolog n=1 Tax=Drosophila melanogaster TaxID=7227 RepID=CL16A_DROME|nr:endosomal maturation defective, isoform A [Drosophila melanogaster]Q9VEV4.2 RecName: Full=Protein CLEC16A homolog; AltName: Full=Endosomal maturation defective protein [Drosophila melanogaster]AAF55313.2 endosomal maturation defective, isoform A [Drosophila melanogaster]|eukprot:NP_650542.1 endosomal maturation defective, isoform A [Drosophila melanogaster]
MFRSRSWFGGPWGGRPKNRLSLEHLKYLYSILEKNTTVSESNRGLLVESLRCIAEILIWGDQHDSLVFDFFLEKNMLSYFLHIMRQKSGGSSFVCVQLLQTLNILFENIRNETSLYYLLSNNHVNSIMVHKFDFSDEDVMGYYILFLKTLSLKLNTHTIHFFYNEHTNDFPLYTEAIKFFNHPESMVRIAVRTISLNVYKVQNPSMLRFIRDKTAAPYFSNLVWFIGKHILELDTCVRTDIDHQSNQKLSNLVAEHLDHLHYLSDILLLEIKDLNAVLTEHLLHKLFVPLYIFSLTPAPPPPSLAVVTQNLAAVLNRNVDIDIQEMHNPRVSSIVALFLLSLVFLVVSHAPLVHALAWVILNGDHSVFKEGAAEILNSYVEHREVVVPGFGEPDESLEQALDTVTGQSSSSSYALSEDSGVESSSPATTELDSQADAVEAEQIKLRNITDEEKQLLQKSSSSTKADFAEMAKPFLDTVLHALDCTENDYLALLSLCLIYAMSHNRGIKNEWFEQVLAKSTRGAFSYKTALIEHLLNIITQSSQPSSRIRLITVEIALELLVTFTRPSSDDSRCITAAQQDLLFSARNQSMVVIRNFYKSEDIFLDLFEDEYNEMRKAQLNVEFLCMDSTILLPPTGTPLTGINFTRRLPCGEVEKARRAIRVYFLLRRTCQKFLNEKESLLPLTNVVNLVQVENVLDLNNSDLIACTVVAKDSSKQRRFLVIDALQLILVEPDAKLLGWGVAKFVGFLQDVEVQGDKDDSRCLHITVHRGGVTHNRTPLLSAKFLFDDHIRCMAAKQRLTKGRSKARQKKMYQIAQLIEIPGQMDSPVYAVGGTMVASSSGGSGNSSGSSSRSSHHRPMFSTANRVPGFAAVLRGSNSAGVSRTQMAPNRSIEGIRNESAGRSRRRSPSSTSGSNLRADHSDRERSPSVSMGSHSSSQSRENSQPRSTGNRSRESSPRMPRPRSEEIPLEDFQHSRNNSPHSRGNPSPASRSHTPIRVLHYDQLSGHSGSPREASLGGTNALLSQLNGLNREVLPTQSSEETSFIGSDGNEATGGSEGRRRGAIETV